MLGASSSPYFFSSAGGSIASSEEAGTRTTASVPLGVAVASAGGSIAIACGGENSAVVEGAPALVS
jgi:hypothetical protein